MTQEEINKNYEKKIASLEKQVDDLTVFQKYVMGVLKLSRDTKFYFKGEVVFDKETRIGMFGKDTVKQQSAPTPTLAEVVTALKNYGLLS